MTDAGERRLLSMADARRRIRVGEDVVEALVDGGAVAAVTTHVAVDGGQVRVVSAADVDLLASLDALARETTTPAALLGSLLEAMGVEPVFRGGRRGARPDDRGRRLRSDRNGILGGTTP